MASLISSSSPDTDSGPHILSNSPSNSSTSSSSSISTPTPTPTPTPPLCGPHRHLAVLSLGPISSLALCGDFLLSASDHLITLWQYPFLSPLSAFGPNPAHGPVKSLLPLGNRLLSAHHDARIRIWALSSSKPDPNPEKENNNNNMFTLTATLPTRSDTLSRILISKQSNYVQTRGHHRNLWIQHADAVSCLAALDGLIYSGSWDKTIKVWRASDFKCIESINAHHDAINALVACDAQKLVYSGSADGKIKAWGRREKKEEREGKKASGCALVGCLDGHDGVSWNAVIVCRGGGLVYGGGSDGRVMGWEKKENEWRLVCDVRAHEGAVLSLCSGSGEFVCSGSADRSIGVWRREEGGGGLVRVGRIGGHEGAVKCLQVSDMGLKNKKGGGFVLYSGGLDGSLRVWWVPTEYGEVEEEEEGGMGKCVLLR